MIGCKMGSSLAWVYIIAKTSSLENFKHRCQNDMAVNMASFYFIY